MCVSGAGLWFPLVERWLAKWDTLGRRPVDGLPRPVPVRPPAQSRETSGQPRGGRGEGRPDGDEGGCPVGQDGWAQRGAGRPDRRGVARRAGRAGRARGRSSGTEGAGPERSRSWSRSLQFCAQTARKNWGAGDCAVSAPLPSTGARGRAGRRGELPRGLGHLAFEPSRASGLGEGMPWFSLREFRGLNGR